MASPDDMNIESFREYYLLLGDVTEKTPFGKFLCRAKRQGRLAARFNSHPLVELKVDSVLVFYVCEHMFCMVDMDNFTYAVVKNTPEKIAELHETRNSVERQRNMMAKYWILCGAKRQSGISPTSVAMSPTLKSSTS